MSRTWMHEDDGKQCLMLTLKNAVAMPVNVPQQPCTSGVCTFSCTYCLFARRTAVCRASVQFFLTFPDLTPVPQPALKQSERQKAEVRNLFLFVLLALFFCPVCSRWEVGLSPAEVPCVVACQSHRLPLYLLLPTGDGANPRNHLHGELRKHLAEKCS